MTPVIKLDLQFFMCTVNGLPKREKCVTHVDKTAKTNAENVISGL